MPEPFRLVSVGEMRALEAAAVRAGTAERELQERAGLAIADVAQRTRRRPGRVAALVGRGNNGRDAMVAARDLVSRGWRAHLWLAPNHTVEPHELAALADLGVTWSDLPSGGADPSLESSLASSELVLDGLLGVGARGPMRSPLREAAETLNGVSTAGLGPLVLAVDVPSGIDADSGEVPGTAVRADVTVTLGAVKAGLLRFPAAELVGRLEIRGIGIPPEAMGALPFRILTDDQRPATPARPLSAHKYDFGRVMVIGGSARYVGAPCLAAAAAARSGAGLVMLAGPESVRQVASIQLPEATYAEQTVTPETDPDQAASVIEANLGSVSAIVLGPGLGRSENTARFLRQVLTARGTLDTPPPTVVDGDALSLLGEWPEWVSVSGPGLILTPHHGEMGRLLGTPAREVNQEPWSVARAQAQAWGQVVVLKGPFTAIVGPDGETWIHPGANPALATAGTGDVLAGTIGGLVAQGLAPLPAALLGVWAHARAARRVLRRHGWQTLLASDLLPAVPGVLAGHERHGRRWRRGIG